MNILFISSLYPFSSGATGKTTALHDIVKYWNRKENVVVVYPAYIYFREVFTGKEKLFFKPKKIVLDNVPVNVYPIFKVPKIAYLYYPLYLYLDKYLKDNAFKANVIIAHYRKNLYLGYKLAKKMQIPLVVGIHITDILECDVKKKKQKLKKIFQYSKLIACRSKKIYSILCDWFPEYKEKYFLAYSGIEKEYIKDNSFAFKELEKGRKEKKIRFITISSLIKRKNIDKVLFVLSNLKKEIEWNYSIIGEGPELINLKKLSKDLKIDKRVIFKGKLNRDDVFKELYKSNIFILISENETFGVAYLEAMAAGNIVIGSKDEGIDGIIEHNKNGYLVNPNNTEFLKNLIEKIVLHMSEDCLNTILSNANQTILNYTEEKASNNYLNRIKSVCK